MSKVNRLLTIPEPRRVEIVEKPYPRITAGFALVKSLITPLRTEYLAYKEHRFDGDNEGPETIGHKGVGEVVELAEGSRFEVGDRVIRKKCRVLDREGVGPTSYVSQRAVEVARRRQRLRPEDTPLRVVVESTIWSLKRGFPASKLPVRGLICSCMVLCPPALMVNRRRLHDYWSEKARESAQKAVLSLSLRGFSLLRGLSALIRRFSGILSSAAAAVPLR